MASQQMVQKGFMKLEGLSVQGDATHEKHKGEVVVLDVSFGVSQSGKYEPTPTSNITNASDVTVRIHLGASGPELAQACGKKTAIKKMVLTIGSMKATFESLLVTSLHAALSAEHEHPTTTVSFSWRKLEWNQGSDPKGTGKIDLDEHH